MKRKHEISRAMASQSSMMLIAYLGLFLGIVPVLVGVITQAADRNWSALAVWLMCLSVLVVVLRQALRPAAVPPPETRYFHPFRPLSLNDAWPRDADVRRVLNALDTRGEHVPLVIGSSGTGKTTLLTTLLPSELESGTRTAYVDVYPSSGQSEHIRQLLKEPLSMRGTTLVVLDQFEQLLAQMRQEDPHRRREEAEKLRELVQELNQGDSTRIIISLRKEWYYDLRFLGPLTPEPAQACDIKGPRADDSGDQMRNAIRSGLATALDSTASPDEVLQALGGGGRLLPLEAQIIGAMLERVASDGDSPTAAMAARGVPGLIDDYFKSILEGAPDRRVVLKVLCALSVKTRFRTQETAFDIRRCIFEPASEVTAALDYLSQQHLVVERGHRRYELAHDYVAEYFNSKSGAEMDPFDRDNIQFHVEVDSAVNTDVIETEEVVRRRRPLGQIVVIPLYVLMLLRLLYLGIPWTVSGNLEPRPLFPNLIDLAYIPIFIPDLVWITYVAAFYDRFLRFLKESTLPRLASIAMVFNLIVCVALGVFVPFSWVVAIGWGGVLVGVKFVTVGMRKDLNRAASDRLHVYGVTTLFNLLFLSAMGAAFWAASERWVTTQQTQNQWLLASVCFSVMLSYACKALWPVHVSREATSRLLGLVARLKYPRTRRLDVE